MSSGALVVLCLIGVVLAIVLNYKWNLNMGVSALVFALIIGNLFMGMRVKEVVALFPTSIYFQVMCLSLFFGWGVVNGTMEAVANPVLHACRTRPRLIGIAMLAIGLLLGIIGCTPPAAGAITAVMIFSIAVPAGMNPLLGVASAYGNNAGSFVLWGASGGIISATIAANGFESTAVSQTWVIFGLSVLLTVVNFFIFFFIYKGYKMNPIPDMQKPEPFTAIQKKNLYVIAVVIFFAVVPGVINTYVKSPFTKALSGFCDMQVLCLIGFIVCAFMKLADQRAVVKAVPWNTLLLLGGVSCLMSVATQAGAVDIITQWLAGSIPAVLLPMFLCLVGGFLSAFSGGITVVFPMVAPMVPVLVEATGANPALLFLGIVVGAHFTSMSPFSTGGAVYMATCRDEAMAKKLVPGQILVAVISLLVSMVIMTLIALFV